MPAQSYAPSADEPVARGNHHGSALTPEEVDRDILDEDSLLEDQPYASLERPPETYGPLED